MLLTDTLVKKTLFLYSYIQQRGFFIEPYFNLLVLKFQKNNATHNYIKLIFMYGGFLFESN